MDFTEWLAELKREYAKQSDMTAEEADAYVEGCGLECWRESYDDEMTPAECCEMEMSYWENDDAPDEAEASQ